MSKTLPRGWILSSLETIAFDISYGHTAKAASGGSGLRMLRITDIQNQRVNWDTVPFCDLKAASKAAKKYLLEPGDLVFARTGATTGKSFLIGECPDAVFASYLIRVRASKVVNPKFLSLFFRSRAYWEQITEQVAGSAQPNCNASKLASLAVPLAPLAEQHRIISKLTNLLIRVDGCRESIARVQDILKRFRRSIVAAACSGRLTADWRKENPTRLGIADESSGLPQRWKSVCVGDVIENLKYGTAQKCDYEKRGVPVLRIPNVASGIINHSDLKYAKLPSGELKQLRLVPGDILMIRSNGSVSLVGKCALVRDQERGFAYAGYLIRMRPISARIDPRFLNIVLSSYGVRLQIELEARSTSGVNNINSEEVRALRFFLPTLLEQMEIVRRIEEFVGLADRIEARFESARIHADKLTPSLLAKAFRGELVPTEADLAAAEGREFESATQLLARIKSLSQPVRGNSAGPHRVNGKRGIRFSQ
jgi:type I restriction enzyme S subunit